MRIFSHNLTAAIFPWTSWTLEYHEIYQEYPHIIIYSSIFCNFEFVFEVETAKRQSTAG